MRTFRLRGSRKKSYASRKLILYASAVVVGVSLVVTLFENQAFLTLLLAVFFVFTLWKNATRGKRLENLILISGAFLGSTAEVVATNLGVWRYAVATPLGIPCWLPLAWGLGSYLIYKFSESLENLLNGG